jgi:hypothetical protein
MVFRKMYITDDKTRCHLQEMIKSLAETQFLKKKDWNCLQQEACSRHRLILRMSRIDPDNL